MFKSFRTISKYHYSLLASKRVLWGVIVSNKEVFRTISGFRGIFHFDLVRGGWA